MVLERSLRTPDLILLRTELQIFQKRRLLIEQIEAEQPSITWQRTTGIKLVVLCTKSFNYFELSIVEHHTEN